MQVALTRCAALLLCACNQLYDLDPTKLASEVQECPPLGTVPEYSSQLISILPRECYNYTLDENGRALAMCIVDERIVIEEGEPDHLEPALITPSAGQYVDDPVLTPEGDHLIIHQYGNSPDVNVWSLYGRDGDRWTFERDVMTSPITFATLGVPSRGPDRRAMFETPTEFRELAEQRDWTAIRTSSWSELGVAGGAQLNLSPDGLRLVFLSNRMMLYADRSSLDEPFGIARPMTSIPKDVQSTIFMSANCARAYVSGLGSVFYMSQR